MADSILGRFVWHELMSPDPKAAGKFYSKVIGWRLQPWGEDKSYTMFMAGKAGMGGLMALPSKTSPPMWMVYIATPDIDATVKKASSLGATVLKGVTPIPTIGRFAVMKDPQGAVFIPFTPDMRGGPTPAEQPAVMDFSWHELATTDAPGALAFYRKVFGWQATETMDMGPMGKYHMYGLNGRTMGGVFTKPEEMPGPPAWLAYIRVADTNATAKAIVKAGGTVINGPMQVPGGDWIAQALDPQGVMFAVHSVTPKRASAPRKAVAAKPKPAARKAAAKGARKKIARPAAPKRAAKTSKQGAARRPRR